MPRSERRRRSCRRDAVSPGERAPIDELQFTLSTSRLNDQAVAAKAGWTLPKVRRDASRVHEELLAEIHTMSDARWRAPPPPPGPKPPATPRRARPPRS